MQRKPPCKANFGILLYCTSALERLDYKSRKFSTLGHASPRDIHAQQNDRLCSDRQSHFAYCGRHFLSVALCSIKIDSAPPCMSLNVSATFGRFRPPIAPKIKSPLHWTKVYLGKKFRDNRACSFLDILFTDKQTDKQTDKLDRLHYLLGGGN